MRLTLRDAYRVAYRRKGAAGLLAPWLPTVHDLFKSTLKERAHQREITVSKARLIALAGPLTILAGSVWLVASIGDLVLRIGPGRAEKHWDLFLNFWGYSFFLSFVPLLIALIGTRLRFHHSAGVVGRLGLALSVAGGAGVVVFVLANLLLGGVAPGVGRRPWVNYAAGVSPEHHDRVHTVRC